MSDILFPTRVNMAVTPSSSEPNTEPRELARFDPQLIILGILENRLNPSTGSDARLERNTLLANTNVQIANDLRECFRVTGDPVFDDHAALYYQHAIDGAKGDPLLSAKVHFDRAIFNSFRLHWHVAQIEGNPVTGYLRYDLETVLGLLEKAKGRDGRKLRRVLTPAVYTMLSEFFVYEINRESEPMTSADTAATLGNIASSSARLREEGWPRRRSDGWTSGEVLPPAPLEI